MDTQISPALEDYLEAILVIQENSKVARVKDLATQMDVKAPSVNEALSNLKKKGLISQEPYGYIELTSDGQAIAREVLSRHKALKQFFGEILGVKEKTAEEDACKIEHYLSKETVKRLLDFIEARQKDGKR